MELQGAVGLESAVNFRSVHRVHYFSFKSEHEERKSEVVRSVSATKWKVKLAAAARVPLSKTCTSMWYSCSNRKNKTKTLKVCSEAGQGGKRAGALSQLSSDGG